MPVYIREETMDQMLKQRLLGAIVIISLAVIFIPMILEGPDDELSPRTQNMPPPPTIDYETDVDLPVPAEPPEAGTSSSEEVPEQEVSAVLPEPSESHPEAAASHAEATEKQGAPGEAAAASESAPAKQPPVKAPPRQASAVGKGEWILQVGSFSQPANARSLQDRLSKSGYQVTVQSAKGADGAIHRVLVGPVSDRPAAEKLRDKLAREQKLTAMILENK